MPGTQQNYIGGTWVPAVAAAPNINPSNLNDVIADYARAQPAEADAAIAAATAAFAAYSRSTPQERYEALKKISDEILARKDELGRLLSREEGKTLPEGIGEVVRAGQVFAFFAGEAVRMSGEKIASTRPGIDVEITREPVGVVALITPWNFPMAIPAWKIAPALAYGNCVVFKPADLVPGSAHALAGIISKSGLPPGVFNLVMGRGSEIGDALLQHTGVAAVSFTGSVATAAARSRRPRPRRRAADVILLRANVVLAVFNLFPIPPLDGGRIAVGMFPRALASGLARLEPHGMLILIGLLVILPMLGPQMGVDPSIVSRVIASSTSAVIDAILRLTGNT